MPVRIRLPTESSLLELAQAQSDEEELKKLIKDPECSLIFIKIQWGPDHTSPSCDLTGEALRLYIPPTRRKRVFDFFHNPVHPSARVTHRIIGKRYFWRLMLQDVSTWCASSRKYLVTIL